MNKLEIREGKPPAKVTQLSPEDSDIQPVRQQSPHFLWLCRSMYMVVSVL